jgi:hypothetical protein
VSTAAARPERPGQDGPGQDGPDQDGPDQDGQGQDGQGQDGDAALSALEAALQQALSALPRSVVARCVAAALPAEILVEDGARLHGGKVKKVSVSMPEELIETVRGRTGAGGFSRYVTEAVDREIRNDLLGDYLDELDAEYGPVPEELLKQARREWPDYEES